jgi:hypothetical protein
MIAASPTIVWPKDAYRQSRGLHPPRHLPQMVDDLHQSTGPSYLEGFAFGTRRPIVRRAGARESIVLEPCTCQPSQPRAESGFRSQVLATRQTTV